MTDMEETPKGILRKGGEERKPKGEIRMVVEETSDNTSGDDTKRGARRSRLVRKQTGAAPTDEEEQARKRIVKNHLKGEGAALKARSSSSGGESGSEVESHSQIGRSSDVTTKPSENTEQPSSRRGCVVF